MMMKTFFTALALYFSLVILFLAGCTEVAPEATEEDPEKDYYPILGISSTNSHGFENIEIIVNYKGNLKAIDADEREIDSDITNIEEACMYGYIDGKQINAQIKKCPE